jgi:hypothetical protein
LLAIVAAGKLRQDQPDENADPAKTAAADEKTADPQTPSQAKHRRHGRVIEADALRRILRLPDAAATSADLPDSLQNCILDQVRSKLQALDSLKCELHETVMMAGMSFACRLAPMRRRRETGFMYNFMYLPEPANGQVTMFSNWRLDVDPMSSQAPETARGELVQVSDGTVLFTHMEERRECERLTRRNLRDVYGRGDKGRRVRY